MNNPVRMFWLESQFGVTLDCDTGLQSLVARHLKSSSQPAIAYLIQNGIKREVQRIKC